MLTNKLLHIKREIESKTNPSYEEKRLLELISLNGDFEQETIQKIVNAYDKNDLENLEYNCRMIIVPGGNIECSNCGRTLKKGFTCNKSNCQHK